MAELEILNVLVGFLCPTNEAASTCNEFISNHSQILPPIGPVFYFLLFPAVFTILFVMILMNKVNVTKDHKGMQILFGATAFIFIIISGWYPIMLILSEFWYIAMILLGFMWFITGHFGGKGASSQGGGHTMPGLGGTMGGILTASVEKHQELKPIRTSIDKWFRDAEMAAQIIHSDKTNRGAWDTFNDAMRQVHAGIEKYEEVLRAKSAKNIATGFNITDVTEDSYLKHKRAEIQKLLSNMPK